uniref:Uncharacterized protein n=1 Tax=Triticum urartu TaxID=4572 RepID=A0A8R7Q3A6_TRIUA
MFLLSVGCTAAAPCALRPLRSSKSPRRRGLLAACVRFPAPSPTRLPRSHLRAALGDGGAAAAVQVRAVQDRREGGLPRHAPLLRHGQPPPPPPWSYPLIWQRHF